MAKITTRTLCLIVLAALGGCQTIKDALGQEVDPAYCKAHPENQVCKDTYPDAQPPGCMTSDECAAPTPVCEIATRTCVECTQTESGACTGATPVCGIDDTCRACTMHSQCSSDVCLPDGSCSDGNNVAYVDPAGSDNTMCTKAMPCTKVAKALATNRQYVKFHGTTNEQVSINNQSVTVLADPGAKLTYTGGPGIILKIDGASIITIYDLEIADALGATGTGISLQNGNTAVVRLERLKITGNGGTGVSASGGTLALSKSTVSGNAGGGISLTGSGAIFTITNNFIYRNGNNTTAAFGGVDLGVTSAGPSRLEFNTIVDNQATSGPLNAGGVRCSATSFAAPNNIIARNLVGASTTDSNAQTLGACTYPTSTVASTLSGLAFAQADSTPFDYHLTAGSMAIDKATTPTTVTDDIDGDPRPQGAAPDQGADELR